MREQLPPKLLSCLFSALCVLLLAASGFAQAAPARFVMFERSGHAPCMEENAKMLETLREFLRG